MTKDELIPTLRFNKFNEKWNRFNLGDISDIGKGFTPSTQNSEFWDINTQKAAIAARYPRLYHESFDEFRLYCYSMKE